MEPISTAMRAPRRGPMPGKLRMIAASGRAKNPASISFSQSVSTRQHGTALDRQFADQPSRRRRRTRDGYRLCQRRGMELFENKKLRRINEVLAGQVHYCRTYHTTNAAMASDYSRIVYHAPPTFESDKSTQRPQ
jgi:hypothetical protein